MLWVIEAIISAVLLSTTGAFAKHAHKKSSMMQAPAFLAALFILMGLMTIPYMLITRQALWPGNWWWVVVIAGLASFAANLGSFNAYLRAPNVGYPAVWQQLSPILLAGVGAIFLGQPIGLLAGIGILLAVAGSILVALARHERKHQGQPWVHLMILFLIFITVMVSLNTWLARQGVSPATTLLGIFWVAGLAYLVGLRQYRVLAAQSWAMWKLLIIAAVIATAGNLIMFFAYAHAPNQGYASALNAITPFLAIFWGYLFLSQPMHKLAIAGLGLTIAGSILIVLA